MVLVLVVLLQLRLLRRLLLAPLAALALTPAHPMPSSAPSLLFAMSSSMPSSHILLVFVFHVSDLIVVGPTRRSMPPSSPSSLLVHLRDLPQILRDVTRKRKIITKPMDLGTVARKLAKEGAGGYLEHEEFAADVQLVFDNAMKYNGPVNGSIVVWSSFSCLLRSMFFFKPAPFVVCRIV